ncbi:phosphatase PAP2 family protein [bacterium]|nr:phosphatase PAP2 family protein [bacterium]
MFGILKTPEVLDFQIDYLILLQNFRTLTGGKFDELFVFITRFGEILIPLVIIAIFYWCLNKKQGAFLLLSTGIAEVFNQFLKMTACIYRPWILSSRIQPSAEVLKTAGGYSFPSGHTTMATSLFGGIALLKPTKLIIPLMLVIIFLVALSRNYLGVHTIQDVVFGFLISLVVMLTMFCALKKAEKYKYGDLIIFLLGSFCAFGLLLYIHFKSFPLDYVNGELLVNPEKMKSSSYLYAGYAFGAFLGWFTEKKLINFELPKTKKEGIIRFLIGIVPLIILLSHSRDGFILALGKNWGTFLNFFAFSFYVTVLYPLVIKFGLSKIKFFR